MANNVLLPAQGAGDTTPKVSTRQLADGSQVQLIQPFDWELGYPEQVLPSREVVLAQRALLFGDSLLTGYAGGTGVDLSFWNNVNANAGTTALSAGATVLATNTTANGAAGLYSLPVARLLPSTYNSFEVWAKNDAATANNLRRWGPYDANNGFFWQVSASGFGVGSRRATVDTVIASGSFVPGGQTLDTLWHRYGIVWGANDAYFYQDGKLVHSLPGVALANPAANGVDVACSLENINSGSSTTAVNLALRGFAVAQYGQPLRANRYRRFASVVNNNVIKLGAGRLLRVLVSNPVTGATITLADNATVATSGILAVLSLASQGDRTFDLPFNLGLTVTTSSTADCLVFFD